jgi:hypothetical protein
MYLVQFFVSLCYRSSTFTGVLEKTAKVANPSMYKVPLITSEIIRNVRDTPFAVT